MEWEKKDDKNSIGSCILSSLEESYLEEEVHIPDPLKEIFHDYLGIDKLKKPMVNKSESIVIPELEIITRIKDEIDSRGCFAIDIPKLVDVLFKLGIIVSREDFK